MCVYKCPRRHPPHGVYMDRRIMYVIHIKIHKVIGAPKAKRIPYQTYSHAAIYSACEFEDCVYNVYMLFVATAPRTGIDPVFVSRVDL